MILSQIQVLQLWKYSVASLNHTYIHPVCVPFVWVGVGKGGRAAGAARDTQPPPLSWSGLPPAGHILVHRGDSQALQQALCAPGLGKTILLATTG